MNNLQPKINASVNVTETSKNTRICPCIVFNLFMKYYWSIAYTRLYIRFLMIVFNKLWISSIWFSTPSQKTIRVFFIHRWLLQITFFVFAIAMSISVFSLQGDYYSPSWYYRKKPVKNIQAKSQFIFDY